MPVIRHMQLDKRYFFLLYSIFSWIEGNFLPFIQLFHLEKKVYFSFVFSILNVIIPKIWFRILKTLIGELIFRAAVKLCVDFVFVCVIKLKNGHRLTLKSLSTHHHPLFLVSNERYGKNKTFLLKCYCIDFAPIKIYCSICFLWLYIRKWKSVV